jgi:2-phospho-L-lactate guanylyltransferase
MKPLKDAKSRLSTILNPEERQQLVLSLFTHTIVQLQECAKFDGIAVITADPIIAREGERLQIHVIPEETPSDLNTSLTNALPYLKERKVAGMLILPGDLPYLNARVLQDMASEIEAQYTMMISPDHLLMGTNALYINPIDNLHFCYGEHSYSKHIQFARQMHYNVKMYLSDPIKVDIDGPEDYKQHQEILALHLKKQTEADNPDETSAG